MTSRFGNVVIVTLVIGLVLAIISTSTAAHQQPDPSREDLEATIAALQTQVAQFEAQGASVLPSPTVVSPTDAESSTDANPGLFGPGLEMLPPGEPGEISVVLVGEYETWLPVIIRNNTAAPVSRVEVSAAAQSPAGELIGAGNSLEFLPNVVEPGEYAIGNVSFSFLDLPPDTSFEFTIESQPGDFETILHDLTVVSAIHQGDRIVGEIENSSGVIIDDSAQVTFACMDSAGNLTKVDFTYTADGSIDPGEIAIFQIDEYYFPCDVFVLTASGYGPF